MNKNVKTALIIGGVAIAILVVVPLVFGLIGGWQGYGGWGMMGGFGMMGFMGIFWALGLGLIIWAVVVATHRSGESNSGSGRGESAQEILKRRYASGDIDKEEYEAKRRDLV